MGDGALSGRYSQQGRCDCCTRGALTAEARAWPSNMVPCEHHEEGGGSARCMAWHGNDAPLPLLWRPAGLTKVPIDGQPPSIVQVGRGGSVDWDALQHGYGSVGYGCSGCQHT